MVKCLVRKGTVSPDPGVGDVHYICFAIALICTLVVQLSFHYIPCSKEEVINYKFLFNLITLDI